MFEWVLNASLLPVKKNEKLSYMKNFMAPFYEWGSIVARLQSHYEEIVYLLPLSFQDFLVLI